MMNEDKPPDAFGEIRIWCQQCFADNTASLSEDYFMCSSCGSFNELDNKKWIARQKSIMKKVFGTKPEKPENN